MTDARPLYVSRPLTNGADLVAWAKSQGFKTCLQPADMHVTVLYSHDAMDWPEADSAPRAVGADDSRSVVALGDKGAIALKFQAPALRQRWQELRDMGGSHDFPDFTPHVTLTWNGSGINPAEIEPYGGPLLFGPERFKQIDETWSPSELVEKTRHKAFTMAHALKNLVLNEVSLVDRGANQHAHITLFKRDPPMTDAILYKSLDGLDAESTEYLKREFSADDRKALAAKGAPLPDGSFPIESTGDLKNAVKAFGRAKDPAKAKAHIIARAKALGASDALPDAWKVGKLARVLAFLDKHLNGVTPEVRKQMTELMTKDASDGDSSDFNDVMGDMAAGENVQEMLECLSQACAALWQSCASILDDETCEDKQGAMADSFGQYRDHLQGMVPAQMTKALGAALGTAQVNKEAQHMADDVTKQLADLTKQVGDITKQLSDSAATIAKLQDENSVLKMSAEHKGFMDGMSGDAKDKFKAMSPAERDQHMKDNPVEKRLPESIRKQLAEAAESVALVKKLQAAAELTDLRKRADEIGLPDTDESATLLQKVRSGDVASITKLEDLLKALKAQADTGELFKEFGTTRGGDTTSSADAQMRAKAAELKKSSPHLSDSQAFAKVYEDRANRDLVAQHKREQRARVKAA